jgi:hypothetical protein
MKLGETVRSGGILLRNLAWGGNVASLALVTQPKEMARYLSESLFLYKSIGSKRGLAQKNVFEVLPCDGIQSVKLGNLTGDQNFFGDVASYAADLINLCLICRIIKPKVVFEIGTLKGYTAFHFALNSPPDAKVYTMDLPKDMTTRPKLKTTLVDDRHFPIRASADRMCFEGSEEAAKITTLLGDSATFDYSTFHGKVDFFFIDGAHSYDYVRSDTLNALKCCHEGSVLAWHDFGRVGVNGVTRWLLELSKEMGIYSVPGGTLAFSLIQ